ncbi:MAG TPA: hypothetical protein VIY86_09745, partial [Pirellulaceae bacterium]
MKCSIGWAAPCGPGVAGITKLVVPPASPWGSSPHRILTFVCLLVISAHLAGCARNRWAVDPPLTELAGTPLELPAVQPTQASSSTIVRYQDPYSTYDVASA